MKFDEEYTRYYEDLVENKETVDGTKLPGINEANHFLKKFRIQRADSIIDLGCSIGRMYEVLNKYSDNIYGVEPDPYAVKKAEKYGYREVRTATAENTSYPSEYFDFVFSWAVFDVVDILLGLLEINRILKLKGKFLITGKGNTYLESDIKAYKAEKNAYLKRFPNRFTNILEMCKSIDLLGNKVVELYTFQKRGDMGQLNYKKENLAEIINTKQKSIVAYEYLIIGEKVSEPKTLDKLEITSLHSSHTETAKILAKKKGYSSVEKYFESVGIN